MTAPRLPRSLRRLNAASRARRCWCGRSISADSMSTCGCCCVEHDQLGEITTIPLSQGLVAVIDAADAPAVLAAGKWSAHRQKHTFYAVRSVRRPDGSRGFMRLHNFITDWPYVDHIDGNGLNNRRSNLRPADEVTNGRNRRLALNNQSGYTGVCWNEQQRHWRAYIYDRGKNIYLGAFADPAEAARARDAAAVELHGEYARLNFPATEHDAPPATPPRLPEHLRTDDINSYLRQKGEL